MPNYVKPQTPLYSKENEAYFYPLTTSDQVIMPDGSRLTPDKLEAMILETATPDAIGAMSMELLWENASPTSEFGEQEIPLEFKTGEFAEIEFHNNSHQNVRIAVGKTCYVSISTYGEVGTTATYNNMRSITVTTEGISFGNNLAQTRSGTTYSATAIANLVLVPHKIYRVKRVSA